MLWTPQLYFPMGKKPAAAAAAAATTWDPSHKTNATLSNGNLTTTHSGGGNSDLNTFSAATNTSNQKVYFEITVVQLTFSGNIGVAQDDTSTSRNDGVLVSPTTGGLVVSNGNFRCLDSADDNTNVIATFAAGDTIDVAFDSGSKKIWFRKNNGNWNASIGVGDPAAGTGGVAVTNTPSTGPWYAFIGADAVDGDGFTARFSSASWTHSAPSGFTQLAA